MLKRCQADLATHAGR